MLPVLGREAGLETRPEGNSEEGPESKASVGEKAAGKAKSAGRPEEEPEGKPVAKAKAEEEPKDTTIYERDGTLHAPTPVLNLAARQSVCKMALHLAAR